MRFSENYKWFDQDLLGEGAMGNVYKGYDKKTGEEVAIKVLKKVEDNLRENYFNIYQRELEVMKKLNHVNIVNFISEEHELSMDRNIIVMEFCNGGSLFQLLKSPENCFGFNDKAFLEVLDGIVHGMEELRKVNIIHRDIKPDNIMRNISLDGRITYKLVDFGAARELMENESFQSIYGTEEYLHPEMYKRAFFNKEKTSFNESVDLWSIGATLYHVASGELPFTTPRMRNDKVKMLDIIMKKGENDISGIQCENNSLVIYNQHLPEKSVMSRGLREPVENLLRNLLQKNSSKCIPFQKFFQLSNQILNMKPISTFTYYSTEILKIFLNPGDSFQVYQEKLSKSTGIKPEDQLLLYENLDFEIQFNSGNPVPFLREIEESNPVFLFSHPDKMFSEIVKDIRKYEMPDVKNYRLSFSSFESSSQSLHYIRRAVIDCNLRQNSMLSGSVMLLRYLMRIVDKLISSKNHFVDFVSIFKDFCINKSLSSQCLQSLTYYEEEFKKLESNIKKTQDSIKNQVLFWAEQKPSCKKEDFCVLQVNALINNLDNVNRILKANSSDSFIKQRRILENQKLANNLEKAKNLVETHCQWNSRELYKQFKTLISELWICFTQLSRHQKDLEDLGSNFHQNIRNGIVNQKDEQIKNIEIMSPKVLSENIKKNNNYNFENECMLSLLSIIPYNKAQLMEEISSSILENNFMVEDLLTNLRL